MLGSLDSRTRLIEALKSKPPRKPPVLKHSFDYADALKHIDVLIKKPLNTKPLESDAWVSGFIEADGSFQVRSTLIGKYPKFECKLEISQRQTDHKGFSNQEF